MLHIITIVWNDAPFLLMQLAELNLLTIPWHWYLVPGTNVDHNAIDRTSDDETDSLVYDLRRHYRITTYPPTRYASKSQQDSVPFKDIPKDAVILYKDADEFYTAEKLEKCFAAFVASGLDVGLVPFRHFVRPDVYLLGEFCWFSRFYLRQGEEFFLQTKYNDPPCLKLGAKVGKLELGSTLMDHYAYIRPKQVWFKHYRRAGWGDIVKNWQLLGGKTLPCDVRDVFPCWCPNGMGLTAYRV